jgi:phosphopantothenoylcysteine synthetase/decarboxylase
MEHISLVDEVSLYLIAPATANVIAKLASGVADDFLTAFFLATKSPVLIAPAMATSILPPRSMRSAYARAASTKAAALKWRKCLSMKREMGPTSRFIAAD